MAMSMAPFGQIINFRKFMKYMFLTASLLFPFGISAKQIKFNHGLKVHEKNAEQYFLEICKQIKLFENNESIVKLFKTKKIIKTEKWFMPCDMIPGFQGYPLSQALDFLYECKYELKALFESLEKITHYSCDKMQPQLKAAFEKIARDMTIIMDAIDCIEESDEYYYECAIWHQESLKAKPVVYATNTQPTPVAYTAPKPVNYFTPVPQPQPVYKPKPVPVAQPTVPAKPAPDSTISPVLEGDVYGTIWSNY
jgi:hypothetical protein